MSILLLVISTVLLGLLVWYLYNQQELRRMSMMQVAKEMNLDFSEIDTFGLAGPLRKFQLFSFSQAFVLSFIKEIENIVSGVLEDMEVFLFDHNYRTKSGSGRDRSVSQTTFVAVWNDRNIPGFRYQHDCWYRWAEIQGKDY